MKIDKPENPNYCASIVAVPPTRVKLDGLDNIERVSIYGYEVLVSKAMEDVIGVFFPAETQLSDQYCFENNLYRHGDRNKNPDEKGYMEDNRRVRAIKFKGNTSNGFFMPLNSLAYTGIDLSVLKVGDEFDKLNGFDICQKYTVARKGNKTQEVANRGFVRADKKFMPEHIDTENFFKNHHKIDPDTEVIVTQKIHGTSIRVANTMVNHKQTVVDRIASFFGSNIIKTSYAYLYGSKKVIKDANNPNQNHYYESDIWTLQGKKLDGLIPENYIVYGELIGWTPEGAEIQRSYTYGISKGEAHLYVYRIAIVNGKGLTTDLSWQQVKEFCDSVGLRYVPELFKCKMSDLTNNDCAFLKTFLDARYFDGINLRQALWLGDNKDIVDEGVCVRAEGLTPKILKAKSPKFLEHETKVLDTGEEDLESSQTA